MLKTTPKHLVLLLILVAGIACANDNATPLIVTSDALEARNKDGSVRCVIAISANELNGDFISALLSWSNVEGQLQVKVAMAPGVIDWRSGVEQFSIPGNAWIQTGNLSTRDVLESKPQSNPSIFGGEINDPQFATDLHNEMLSTPVSLHIQAVEAGEAKAWPLEETMPADAVERARECMGKLR